MFDIQSFSQSTVTGKMDTELTPYPEGSYIFQIEQDEKAVTFASGTSTDKDGKTRPWVRLNVRCRVVGMRDGNLEEVAKARGKKPDELLFTHGFLLDLNEVNQLDVGPGRNIQLGQLREAVNQNNAEDAWHYFMLRGQAFEGKMVIKVDKDDSTKKYNNLVGLAKFQQ